MTEIDTIATTTPSGSATVCHAVGTSFTLHDDGVPLLTYTYARDVADFECPAPYFHPIRTPAGRVVSAHRPHDHRWHKGLAMTISHLSGQNFWGGNTYVPGAPGHGYVALDTVGRLRHDAFDAFELDNGALSFRERITWLSSEGEAWIRESRSVRVCPVEVEHAAYIIEFGTELTNTRGQALEIGSPTTFGRPDAGYSGFFWRGPRDMTGGTILAAGGLEGPEIMGKSAEWLAYTAVHDEVDASSTLIFEQHQGNPDAPAPWFVRNDQFPAVNPSLAFHTESVLEDGDTLARRYRVVVADGQWTGDAVAAYLGEHPW